MKKRSLKTKVVALVLATALTITGCAPAFGAIITPVRFPNYTAIAKQAANAWYFQYGHK